jgi:hypothetical protein
MTFLILTEVGLGALGAAVFIVIYGIGSPWRTTPMGRHIMAFMLATAVEFVSLLFIGLGVPVPLWVFALVFAALDAVVFQRLWLLWLAQRRR